MKYISQSCATISQLSTHSRTHRILTGPQGFSPRPHSIPLVVQNVYTALSIRKSLPDEPTLAAAANLEVLDLNGQAVRFQDLFEDSKTIVVFIRHFFCGICQNYAKHLAAVPDKTLEAANVRTVLVGCGEHTAIKHYAEVTGFRGGIYANPTRSVYHALGMDLETLRITPSKAEKRSYIPDSRLFNAVSSTAWALMHPTLVGKQGNMAQVGGEFILGPGNTCSFASRMQHTEDHVEVGELMKAAGVTLV